MRALRRAVKTGIGLDAHREAMSALVVKISHVQSCISVRFKEMGHAMVRYVSRIGTDCCTRRPGLAIYLTPGYCQARELSRLTLYTSICVYVISLVTYAAIVIGLHKQQCPSKH